MSNYSPIVNYANKDSLISGNPLKLVKGAELSAEFTAIASAITSKFDGSVAFAPDGTAVQPSFGFTNNAGTGMFNAAGVLGFATGATNRLTINAAGLVTALAGLTVSGGAFTSRGISDAATATALSIASGGLVSNLAGLTVSGGAFTSRGISDSATATALSIAASGAITINAGSSGAGLTVEGNATSGVAGIFDSVQASFGGYIAWSNSGTNNGFIGSAAGILSGTLGDTALRAQGQLIFTTNGATTALTITTAQLVNVASALSLAGNPIYAGAPQNNQAAAYTLVLSDANKHIYRGGGSAGIAWTIPANASVPYPTGTMITFVSLAGVSTNIAINTDTLTWSPSGASGTRALASGGMATALKTSATQWVISGTGLT